MTQPSVVMLGKPVADAIEARIAAEVPGFTAKHGIVPTLGIVLVGDSAASARYVKKKMEARERLHMKAELAQLPTSVGADALLNEVKRLSASKDVHALL